MAALAFFAGTKLQRNVAVQPPAYRAALAPPQSPSYNAYDFAMRGGTEIFAQPYPGPGPRVQISNGGGSQVRWRADGKELYYVGPQKRLMAVAVQQGKTFEVGRPVLLFQTRINGARYALFQYTASADGQRFLVNSLPREDAAAAMTLLTDWTSELKH